MLNNDVDVAFKFVIDNIDDVDKLFKLFKLSNIVFDVVFKLFIDKTDDVDKLVKSVLNDAVTLLLKGRQKL
jgi:hypothetical protein